MKVYVSLGGEPRLAVVELAADGSLAEMSDLALALPAPTGAMTHSRRRRRLYLGMRPNHLATVELDTAGRPRLLGVSPAAEFPAYLSVARDESLIVCALFGAGQLTTHYASGSPPHPELHRLPTAAEPHAALVDTSDRRIYVPHRNGMTTDWFDLAETAPLRVPVVWPRRPATGHATSR